MINYHPEKGILLYNSDISIFVFLNKGSYFAIIDEPSLLSICTEKQFDEDTLSIGLSVGNSSNNLIEDFKILGTTYLHPPTVVIGPEETFKAEIEIKEFLIGSIFDWHPELPYANLYIEFKPLNEDYTKNETLFIKFRDTTGEYKPSEPIPYNSENKKWRFPESGTEQTKQIKFDYNSWWFPLAEYKTTIFIENDNISIIVDEDLDISASRFLEGRAINSTSEGFQVIEITIFQNGLTYVLLIIIFIWFYTPLILAFRETKRKRRLILFQLTPIITIFIEDLIRAYSILFCVLILSIIILWAYVYKKK